MSKKRIARLIEEIIEDSQRKIITDDSIKIQKDRKKLKLISHRGNLNGPNKKKENSPRYILDAIHLGYDVEVDVWFYKKNYYLGHDKPTYRIESKFLESKKIWCHAKNIEALEIMATNNRTHYFWHQKDDVTLTSKNFVWTYPGKLLIDNSICVLPENTAPEYLNSLKFVGVCSDYISRYK
jgi:hypothetical protein